MAIDVYLKIDGIKGESRDAGHLDWMECLTVDLGVHQPRSAATSSSGLTVGRCHHDTIVIGRLSDLATPILLQACAMGKTLPEAKLEFMRADGQDKPVKYFVIELENVLISEISPEVSEGQPMNEHLALAFSKINPNAAVVEAQRIADALDLNQSHKKVEAALRKPGADSSRPDDEFSEGPDGLWFWGAQTLVIEAKNENQNSLLKKDSGQLHDSLTRIRSNYA